MAGCSERQACREAGISPATLHRWQALLAKEGVKALMDEPRSGRPPAVVLNEVEKDAFNRRYLQSNKARDSGSMTMTARTLALDDDSPLEAETRAEILKQRSSKHILPVTVRRAMRGLEGAAVARYRDPRAGQNNGIYVPAWLRRDEETGRLLLPGERQVWDDASPNVAIAVPWAGRGDPCGDRWGWRAARYQLLAGIDCATDLFCGYGFVMRTSDSYRACDVASVMLDTWKLQGFAPRQVVVEGGSWQANRALEFYRAMGLTMIDAKGQPNHKLIEGYFNRLWTALSIYLPAYGQIGRYRGEMRKECLHWEAVRSGARDPRDHFPTLDVFLGALRKAVAYLQRETVESGVYGHWAPAEAYVGAKDNGQSIVAGIDDFVLPVVEQRKVRRDGMVFVRAETPFEDLKHDYGFASSEAWRFGGAPVIVRFDPRTATVRGAHISLAQSWRDFPAGLVIDAAAPCISPVPDFLSTRGFYDARAVGRREKKASRAAVRTVVAAFDERGEVAMTMKEDNAAAVSDVSLRGGPTPNVDAPVRRAVPVPTQDDWVAMEREAGILTA